MSASDASNTEDRRDLAARIVRWLRGAGFEQRAGVLGEDVYEYRVRDGLTVAVYTTVVAGSVRATGKDAIRVTVEYRARDGKARGLAKTSRVFRVGRPDAIVERLRERARDAFRVAATGKRCRSCGAPTFTSRRGNVVCAELCYQESKHA